jgi:hypothetical protein
VAILVIALAPAVAAIWTVPWFVTQDGPAHVYNAQILAWSFDTHSPFRSVYTINWQPIPNWAGQLVLAGLLAITPAWIADRIMTSVTLVAFAAATLWLRWRVARGRGIRVAALFSALFAMNMAWLLGFHSFLLGACLFSITLGVWWPHRYHLGAGRTAAIAALLCIGYFCHLVSLGLTVLGMVVLSLSGHACDGSRPHWRSRLGWLARAAASFLPLIALGYLYLRIAQQSGPMHPVWENLTSAWSPEAWAARLGWADPLTLAIKDGLPFTERVSRAFVVFAPAAWLGAALMFWWYGRMTAQSYLPTKGPGIGAGDTVGYPSEVPGDLRQGWLLLAALLTMGGIFGPDSLGAAHGEFLPQRALLLGLVALVPVLDVNPARWSGRLAIGALAAALLCQSAIVWDYARYSDRTAGQIIRAGNLVGRKQRVITRLTTSRGRFRANPLLHAENWLGVDTGNIVWNNYETLHYYFPVQFTAGIDRPHPALLELVSIHEDPKERSDRVRDWEHILSEWATAIDVVVVWKRDEQLDAITKRWFAPAGRRGDVEVYRQRAALTNEVPADPGPAAGDWPDRPWPPWER